MATYEVTSPDGITLELEGDQPPTEAQINDIFAQYSNQQQPPAQGGALNAQDAQASNGAGFNQQPGSDSANRADMAHMANAGVMPQPQGEVGIMNRLVSGAGRHNEAEQNTPLLGDAPEMNLGYGDTRMTPAGIGHAIRASAGQMFGLTDESKINNLINTFPDVSTRTDDQGNTFVKLPSGEYVMSRAGADSSDIPAIAANMGLGEIMGALRVGQVVGAGKGVAGLIAENMAATGIQAGASQSVGGDETLESIGTDLAFGVGAPMAMKGLGEVGKFGYRYAKNGTSAERTAAENVIAGANAANPGATVMTSDILPPKTRVAKLAQDIGNNIPFIGTGGQRALQQEERQKTVDNFVEQYGGDLDDIETHLNSEVHSSLKALKEKSSREYSESADVLNELGEVKPVKTIEAINDSLVELTNPNIMQDEKTISYLATLRDTLDGGVSGMGLKFNELKQNRTHLFKEIESIQKGANAHLGSQASSHLKKIRSALSDDMIEFAGSVDGEAGMRWLNANDNYAKFARDVKGGLGGALNSLEKGKQEKVLNLLTTGDINQSRQIYENLTPDGKELAKRGFITKLTGNNEMTDLNPNKFATSLSKNQAQRRLKMMFSDSNGDDTAVMNMLHYLNTTREAQVAGGRIPTGYATATNAPAAATILSGFNPYAVAGVAAAGISNRMYQSEPMRNALIRTLGTGENATTRGIDYGTDLLSRGVSALQRGN